MKSQGYSHVEGKLFSLSFLCLTFAPRHSRLDEPFKVYLAEGFLLFILLLMAERAQPLGHGGFNHLGGWLRAIDTASCCPQGGKACLRVYAASDSKLTLAVDLLTLTTFGLVTIRFLLCWLARVYALVITRSFGLAYHRFSTGLYGMQARSFLCNLG